MDNIMLESPVTPMSLTWKHLYLWNWWDSSCKLRLHPGKQWWRVLKMRLPQCALTRCALQTQYHHTKLVESTITGSVEDIILTRGILKPTVAQSHCLQISHLNNRKGMQMKWMRLTKEYNCSKPGWGFNALRWVKCTKRYMFLSCNCPWCVALSVKLWRRTILQNGGLLSSLCTWSMQKSRGASWRLRVLKLRHNYYIRGIEGVLLSFVYAVWATRFLTSLQNAIHHRITVHNNDYGWAQWDHILASNLM